MFNLLTIASLHVSTYSKLTVELVKFFLKLPPSNQQSPLQQVSTLLLTHTLNDRRSDTGAVERRWLQFLRLYLITYFRKFKFSVCFPCLSSP